MVIKNKHLPIWYKITELSLHFFSKKGYVAKQINMQTFVGWLIIYFIYNILTHYDF